MNIFRRLKYSIIMLILICIIASAGYVRKAVITVSAPANDVRTVIIDPGHGGFDGGAGADDGTLEKDINLEISLRLRDFLTFYGCSVVMTRETDKGTEDDSALNIAARKKSDMRNRLALMGRGNSIYVSIHLNKFTTTAARGIQVFYTPNFESARLLGECIQNAVKENLQPENRRLIKKGYDSTFLLKKATVPAVIVECGFLSNKSDLIKLKDGDYQKKMAFCISAGIMQFYKMTGQ